MYIYIYIHICIHIYIYIYTYWLKHISGRGGPQDGNLSEHQIPSAAGI